MSWMFFQVFFRSSTHILLDLLSLGSAEAHWVRWETNAHLMASCVRNILTKKIIKI